ncbi:MAG: chromate transporter [Vicinamibacterales bacterium]
MADPAGSTSNGAPAKDLISFLDEYLVRKAPFQIPPGGKEWIVKYGPWITVVLLILFLPALLFVLGVGTVLVPFGGPAYAASFGLATILLIVQIGMMVMALPGLFARKKSGWTLLFYAQLVGLVVSLASGNIIGALIGAVIGLYILFQVRTLYVN